ncbi:F1F0 ATP synthase subunit e, mitochondrial [Tieghemiomyces parasiticus]|uniref:ATP synthase F(0) complex subunit e, mitochondrial n=1 Tax=Tieghemiomyces parasiticus TaxID=78921 RepID=A0A9W8DXF8_9FUNG|nr:F1F0 ATP synthase subunit e, mitochondrial [Tieghemiomyces parasiticus]
MATPLVKYLRWGALTLGVTYGFTHNNALHKKKEQQIQREEYRHKEELIARAKAEYASLKAAQSSSSVITDPENPQFDLEKYLLSVDSSAKA